MAKTTPRLHVDMTLSLGAEFALEKEQGHYLVHVLRLVSGDAVALFNGRDGEWRATLAVEGKRSAALIVTERTREQTAPTDLHYLFAPLKHARLDYMVQKAVEMGVSRLQPVFTRHTQAERVNLARMRANAIEAAEQCGILDVAEIAEPIRLEADAMLERGNLAGARRLYRAAIEKDAESWELWLGLGLASSGRPRQQALDQAKRLNPRAGVLEQLERADGQRK